MSASRLTVALAALTLAAIGAWPTAARAVDPNYVQQVSEAFQKTRDPFRRPTQAGGVDSRRSVLESYPTEGFKMVGVVTGLQHLRAMVAAPNGKTYFVMENQKIGVRKGVIRKISADQILVREKIVNVIGEEENVDVLIRMAGPDEDQESRRRR